MSKYISVIGSDGLVGRALINCLEKSAANVVGTTRRLECVHEKNFFLDLGSSPENWTLPSHIDIAVICAGVTRIEACQNDPAESRKVNVNGTVALIDYLVSKGVFVIYLSTNQVFDGSIPNRSPDDVTCPITEYGRQKAETEALIRKWKESVAIVRFSKILSLEEPLFWNWKNAFQQGEKIHPFSDMVLAPVPLDFAVNVLRGVIDKRLPGVTQASGKYDLTYADAACLGAERLGILASQIQPISAYQTGRFKEGLPKHTTLNCDRLECEFGLVPPDVRQTIQRCFSVS